MKPRMTPCLSLRAVAIARYCRRVGSGRCSAISACRPRRVTVWERPPAAWIPTAWSAAASSSARALALNKRGSTRKRVGDFCMIRERWQKMRNDLHGQVLFVAEAIGLALDDANRVVQPFHTAERDFVLGLAVRNDAVPMTFDHLRELLERLESLPLECILPVLEEFP